MRHILAIFLLLAIAVVSVLGLRGSMSRRPPLELFSDMSRQPKTRPESAAALFQDGSSSRPRPEGTLPQPGPAPSAPVFTDPRVLTGCEPDSTNWIEANPLPVTLPFLERGRDRYQIYCAPCHGAAGDGRGIVMRYNMVAMANFHDRRLIEMTDGEMFNTLTAGKNLMNGYGGVIAIEDRWAVIAYIRALERSRLGTAQDAPAELRPQPSPTNAK